MQRALCKLNEQCKYKHHASQAQIAIQNIEGEGKERRMIRMVMKTRTTGNLSKKAESGRIEDDRGEPVSAKR